jgi:hypothetical protein
MGQLPLTTGHEEPFDKAARKARDRGADVSLLRSP